MVFVARVMGLMFVAAGIGVLSALAQVEELFWPGITLVAIGLLLFLLFSDLINRS